MASGPTALIMNTFIYVSHLYCSGTTLWVLSQQRTADRQQLRNRNRHLLLVGALIAFGTINFVSFCVESTQEENVFTEAGLLLQDNAAFFISVLAQSYLLNRCYVLFGRSKLILIGSLLGLLMVTGFGLACIGTMGRSSFPVEPIHYDYFGSNVTFIEALPLIYWAVSLAFNMGLNALIIIRLLRMRSKVRVALGKEYSQMYTGIAAMLLESSLLYTNMLVVGYWALPQGGTANMFSPLVAQSEGIASELIILRFALGRSLSKSTLRVATANKPDLEANADSDASSMKARAQSPSQTGSTHLTQMYPSSIAAVLRSHNQPEPAVILNRRVEWQKGGTESQDEYPR